MSVPGSVAEALRLAADRFGDRPALSAPRAGLTRLGMWNGVEELQTWTYQQLLEQAERAAAVLQERVGPGERVALWSANCAEWIFSFLGGACAGIPVVILNPGCSDAEAAALVARSGASAVAMTRTHRGEVRSPQAAGGPAVERLWLEDWDELSADPSGARLRATPHERGASVIQYTSGSTGSPKAVLLAEPALLRNGFLSGQCQGVTEHDIAFNATPLSHVGGYAQFLLGGIITGKHMVIAGGFSPSGFLDAVEHFRVTATGAVPTMWLAILEEQRRSPRDISSVRVVSSGATDQPASVVRQVSECFGARYQVFYGMTETSGAVTGTRMDDPAERSWTGVGRALPDTEVRIVEPQTGTEVSPGEPGEIWVRSYGVMLGYLDDPDAGRAAVTPDGWLRTGDLGRVDSDGYLAIVGRLKDMIIKGGENLAPAEIEEAIRTLEGVDDVAVIGVADERWGEVPAAVVLAATGVALEDLAARCHAILGSFRTPTRWMRAEQLPVTHVGKVDKPALRATFRADFSADADLSISPS